MYLFVTPPLHVTCNSFNRIPSSFTSKCIIRITIITNSSLISSTHPRTHTLSRTILLFAIKITYGLNSILLNYAHPSLSHRVLIHSLYTFRRRLFRAIIIPSYSYGVRLMERTSHISHLTAFPLVRTVFSCFTDSQF